MGPEELKAITRAVARSLEEGELLNGVEIDSISAIDDTELGIELEDGSQFILKVEAV